MLLHRPKEKLCNVCAPPCLHSCENMLLGGLWAGVRNFRGLYLHRLSLHGEQLIKTNPKGHHHSNEGNLLNYNTLAPPTWHSGGPEQLFQQQTAPPTVHEAMIPQVLHSNSWHTLQHHLKGHNVLHIVSSTLHNMSLYLCTMVFYLPCNHPEPLHFTS